MCCRIKTCCCCGTKAGSITTAAILMVLSLLGSIIVGHVAFGEYDLQGQIYNGSVGFFVFYLVMTLCSLMAIIGAAQRSAAVMMFYFVILIIYSVLIGIGACGVLVVMIAGVSAASNMNSYPASSNTFGDSYYDTNDQQMVQQGATMAEGAIVLGGIILLGALILELTLVIAGAVCVKSYRLEIIEENNGLTLNVPTNGVVIQTNYPGMQYPAGQYPVGLTQYPVAGGYTLPPAYAQDQVPIVNKEY